MKKSVKRNYKPIFIGLALITVLIVLSTTHLNRFVKSTTSVQDSLALRDSILNEIYNMRMEHPYIVYAQAIIESGNFTSKIWKENNNMFGMKMPERRATLSCGIRYGHSVYKNWRDCLIDYALYQMSYMRGLSEDEYFERLRNSYASDGYYVDKVRKLKQSLSN